jgi:hypothetical protein
MILPCKRSLGFFSRNKDHELFSNKKKRKSRAGFPKPNPVRFADPKKPDKPPGKPDSSVLPDFLVQ